ncbi:MAG: HesA/MoeB/ThiF family protein [Bacteriovoracaceae bacterium]|nr:HesA/MoeB/ThiF family protein [Bacteriovoracaceae bacterium]
MTTSITLNELYQRQITLLGEAAFEKIRNSRILIIGAGGLGCPALQYLSSSGVGVIGIVDFDIVSASNLQRQILFEINDIGRKKVEAAAEKLKKLAPFCNIQVFPFRLDATNSLEIFSTFDVILDCTDNFYTKFLIHDACFKTGKVLIQASVYQYEGQVQMFDFRERQGPCLRCLWPEEPLDGCTATCAEAGVMGPLLGVMGSIQAMEALKLITEKEHLNNGETLFVDLMSREFDVRRFKQKSDCPCCVKHECKVQEVLQVDWPVDLKEFVLVDVRSLEESDQCPLVEQFKKHYRVLQIPLDKIKDFVPPSDQKYLTICARGLRSLNACHYLRAQGLEVYSLRGGTNNILSMENL